MTVDIAQQIAALLKFKPYRIPTIRKAVEGEKTYSRYSPMHLRVVRARNGVG